MTLADRARRSHHSPNALDDETAAAIAELRRGRPTWGPRKLLKSLERRRPVLDLPATSTVGEFLKRSGFIEARRKRTKWKHPGQPTTATTEPNELWAADFKGQLRTRDGNYCYPLTVP